MASLDGHGLAGHPSMPSRSGESTLRRLRAAAWCVVLITIVITQALHHRAEWARPQGWEPLQIAQGLAGGHGFAWHSHDRWLFDDDPRSGFFPTAWTEPVYPLLLGLALSAFGDDEGRRVAVGFQAVCLALTAILTFFVGRRAFGELSGMVASLSLLLVPEVSDLPYGQLQTAATAGLAVVAALWAFLWTSEAPSGRRALMLGAVLGASVLTSAPTLAFVPLALGGLLVANWHDRGRALRLIGACALGLVAVGGPWSIRNYLVFRAFVPSRNGLGQIAFSGNPVLAERFVPGYRACGVPGAPSWTARGALATVRHTQVNREDRNALDIRGFECVSGEPPPGYAAMNEPQRDREYFRRALNFVRSHPGVAAKLALAKAATFFLLGWSGYLRVLTVLAAVGAAQLIRRRAGLAVALAIAGFSSAYVIGMPYFYRYRYPVEPLIALLASYPIAQLLALPGRFGRWGQRASDGHTAPHPG